MTLLIQRHCLFFLLMLMVANIAVRAQPVIYVDHTATTGANNGATWTDAYTSLAKAIYEAHSNTSIHTILVAKGTYYPEYIPPTGSATTDRDKTFYFLRDGLAVYGGFQQGGTGGWEARELPGGAGTGTILSGDLNQSNTLDAEDAYHVIMAVGSSAAPVSNSLVLDGFTISGGLGVGSGSISVNSRFVNRLYGGGISHYGASPTIANCTVSGNRAEGEYGGGGMYNGNRSAPDVSGCTFTGNTAVDGAGMINSNASPKVTNCVFTQNTAASHRLGGGMGNFNTFPGAPASAPFITNTLFSGNTAGFGGGMCNYPGTSVTVINCLFSGNRANSWGGGMSNVNCVTTVTNSSFSGNNSLTGGAISTILAPTPASAIAYYGAAAL